MKLMLIVYVIVTVEFQFQFVNKVTDEDAVSEIEEVVHRLRTTPATVDTLPSTSHAVIRAFMKAGESAELMRILSDRMNYGVFLDFHSANMLMNDFLKEANFRGKRTFPKC